MLNGIWDVGKEKVRGSNSGNKMRRIGLCLVGEASQTGVDSG